MSEYLNDDFEDDFEDGFDDDDLLEDIDFDNFDEIELEQMKKAQTQRFKEGKPLRATGCKCAIETDEYHGWECEVTGDACAYLTPNSKACARDFREGPDAVNEEDKHASRTNI